MFKRKIAKELAKQIIEIRFEELEDTHMRDAEGNINSDYTFWSGVVSGMQFALEMLDKKAIPEIPDIEDIGAAPYVFKKWGESEPLYILEETSRR